MIEGAYLYSHGGVLPGFEPHAMGLGARAQAFWDRYEKEGTVRRVGPFYLAPGGGNYEDMTVFSLYLGRLSALHAIITSEEYERIVAVAVQVTKNFKSRLFGGGTADEVARTLSVLSDEWRRAGFMKG
jgi:hypothetical protein